MLHGGLESDLPAPLSDLPPPPSRAGGAARPYADIVIAAHDARSPVAASADYRLTGDFDADTAIVAAALAELFDGGRILLTDGHFLPVWHLGVQHRLEGMGDRTVLLAGVECDGTLSSVANVRFEQGAGIVVRADDCAISSCDFAQVYGDFAIEAMPSTRATSVIGCTFRNAAVVDLKGYDAMIRNCRFLDGSGVRAHDQGVTALLMDACTFEGQYQAGSLPSGVLQYAIDYYGPLIVVTRCSFDVQAAGPTTDLGPNGISIDGGVVVFRANVVRATGRFKFAAIISADTGSVTGNVFTGTGLDEQTGLVFFNMDAGTGGVIAHNLFRAGMRANPLDTSRVAPVNIDAFDPGKGGVLFRGNVVRHDPLTPAAWRYGVWCGGGPPSRSYVVHNDLRNFAPTPGWTDAPVFGAVLTSLTGNVLT
ncbi:MAG: hypothetical protein KatS3mg014_2452 [Actinomycetota bacterium]|nr:MAG: hypothetical protein KatS3mg014_2452 [Actinomycetota bacterium]